MTTITRDEELPEDLDSFQQHRKLSARHSWFVGQRLERSFLQTFIVKPQTVAVPLDELDPVTPAVQEDVQGAVERVCMKGLADERGEAVVRLPKVDRLPVKEYADRRRQVEHGMARRTRSSRSTRVVELTTTR